MGEYQSNVARLGLNLDNTSLQVPPGAVPYALNAQIDNFNGETLTYQNESANSFCADLPEGYKLIGKHNLIDKGFILLFLTNPTTGDSEIGKLTESDCTYEKLINAKCLNFNVNYPIHKIAHRTTDCATEVFWTDNFNPRRYLDLDNLPFKQIENCPAPEYSDEVDCNKLLIQPVFKIPKLEVTEIEGSGTITAGTYQFAVQYSDEKGNGYTSFYSVTNPTPIFDPTKITLNFDYSVNKSIKVNISNLDTSGYFTSFNLAVIKTVNDISSVELVGTYSISSDSQSAVYTGQGVLERLTITDIFEKFPIYEKANDLTVAQDTLIWADLTTDERISYQSIANKINLNWQTWRVPVTSGYSDPLNSTYLRGYMRDEIYAFEVVFLLKKGKQTDGFHIPGRVAKPEDLESVFNDDVVNQSDSNCDPQDEALPRWKVYNTGSLIDFEKVYTDFVQGVTYPCPKCPPVFNVDTQKEECYTGPYQYGNFAYWESEETYPCTEIWGELANKPIRHHKFPDSVITHIHDNQGFIYPIGVRVDVQQIINLIQQSNLTDEQKANIQGFKIVRSNRVNNKSVVAKGLIHNVGEYEREEEVYLFPNYPYNDLNQDPFISSSSTPDTTDQEDPETVVGVCYKYKLISAIGSPTVFEYRDCDNVTQIIAVPSGLSTEVCAVAEPQITSGTGDVQIREACEVSENQEEVDVYNPSLLTGFKQNSKLRHTFHSPDTHFYQPGLGNILKLETAEFGTSRGRFREVKDHSKYKFISKESIVTALTVGVLVGIASNTVGVSTNVFNGTAAFTAYISFLDIVDKLIPRKNFCYQYNSIGNYTDFKAVANNGNKQRRLTIANYLAPGMINIGDTDIVNNFQRESSVYLKSNKPLPYPHQVPGVPEDRSRWVLSQEDCKVNKTIEKPISSYYAAIKRSFSNQYGQIYSYETIDTGFQFLFEETLPDTLRIQSVFGGDIFINRFGYKSKLPFFIDNRVSRGGRIFPDESDIFYNELGNLGNPNYWFSTDANKGNLRIGPVNLSGIFGIKAHRFDCPDDKFFYDSGKIYLFAYGIPYFYCESEVNVDLRQAFNSSEGDFFPRVSSDIPDEWFQEINTTIQQDNTYHYNKTFSKQSKENLFTHLPNDWLPDECEQKFPYRVIFSDGTDWFTYRPSAKFELPQNYGKLISLDGIENRAVLARFENKSLLYGALLTAPTSAQSVYLGQSLFQSEAPPIDYADTNVGYAGTQNKFFLKTEFGHVSTDAKRGKVLLYQGTKAQEITQGISKFLTENLSFSILKKFPEFPIDNHFNSIGIHGVYDDGRFILTKLDYEPKNKDIIYQDNKFYLNSQEIQLSDEQYFINRSFTISYDFQLKAWVSFHSYLPNFYIESNLGFYSGKDSVWLHGNNYSEFNKFYGNPEPYILENSFPFKFHDEILQSVKDYSRVYKFIDNQTFIDVDDEYFNKLIIYNNQQCSGIINLVPKPKNKLSEYNKYPKYNADSKDVLFTKSDSFYQVNTFWDMVKDKSKPIWTKSNTNLSILREINQTNMDYSKRSFRKNPIRGKDIKLRFELTDKTDIKIVSQINTISTMKSEK